MKSITGKELCKILEKKGWELKNIKGSHHVYMKSGRKERLSVPVHGNKDLKIGLLKAIMKMAEIDENEL
ncbi:MAG: type II toxin-antitoxin system HicA family toxin [Deltaproteobacteria bacterium]|nr:type II toxin-antitoxin system HicA family toxin [Deltaproteobacteria bacterium]MCL5278098.1 type II toxin-antitoxin system HicA family toxin [Deltaproteobacteria bacterium]